MSLFSDVAKDCFTENDGHSYCPIRIVGGLLVLPSIVFFLFASFFMLIRNGAIDLQSFALSLVTMTGAVTGIFSLAIAVKAITDKSV